MSEPEERCQRQGCQHPKSEHIGERGHCNVSAKAENPNQFKRCACAGFISTDSPDEF